MHVVDVIFALLVIRSFDIKFSCWFSLCFVLFVHVFCSGISLGKRKKNKTPVHLTYFVFLLLALLHVLYIAIYLQSLLMFCLAVAVCLHSSM